MVHVHRNFGSMNPAWQDRANKKRLIGFKVTFQDGFVQNIRGGLATIPDQTIQEHGCVIAAKAI